MRFEGVKTNRTQIKLKFGSMFLVFILVCSGLVVITSLTQDFNNATAVSTWTHETASAMPEGFDLRATINYCKGLNTTTTRIHRDTWKIGTKYYTYIPITTYINASNQGIMENDNLYDWTDATLIDSSTTYLDYNFNDEYLVSSTTTLKIYNVAENKVYQSRSFKDLNGDRTTLTVPETFFYNGLYTLGNTDGSFYGFAISTHFYEGGVHDNTKAGGGINPMHPNFTNSSLTNSKGTWVNYLRVK